MLGRVLVYGTDIPNERTGTMTRALFDYKLEIAESEFPFSTVRQAGPRPAFEELWFFLNGKTQTKELEAKGIEFWKGNTSRSFLDSRGLTYLPEGDLGDAYSKQFTNFGSDGVSDGVNQVKKTYETLRDDPYSRRLVTSLWNPYDEPTMCLTPCWWSHQFVVLPSTHGDFLHMKLINRSLDALFGCQFAVMQYRMYQIALSKLLGMNVGKLVCDLTHVHLYENQFEYTKELLTRSSNLDDCYSIDRVQIKKELNTLDDLLSLTWEDWEIDVPWVNKDKFINERPEMVA